MEKLTKERIERAVSNMSFRANIQGPVRIHTMEGGKNNRVFRVETLGCLYLLKAYFHHTSDARNRLDSEFSFASFAWSRGVETLPRPIARDDALNMGLYEFVIGKRLTSSQVEKKHVAQALEFFIDLNRHRFASEAAKLPKGSEACFSLEQHLALIERRVQRVLCIDGPGLHAEAAAFVADTLVPSWEAARKTAVRLAQCIPWPKDEILNQAFRCLSPSDFGFHNAICRADGCLRFIDFEYAGWDDPAKTVCDFFCQPQVPAPPTLFDFFAHGVAMLFPDPERLKKRITVLLPLFQIKWCCIMLNDFLPVDGFRRRFAAGSERMRKQRLQTQLEKTVQFYDKNVSP